jgi:hypothetical protein
VLKIFVRRGILEDDEARGMLDWPHSGFHVHDGVLVPEGDTAFALRLARYCAVARIVGSFTPSRAWILLAGLFRYTPTYRFSDPPSTEANAKMRFSALPAIIFKSSRELFFVVAVVVSLSLFASACTPDRLSAPRTSLFECEGGPQQLSPTPLLDLKSGVVRAPERALFDGECECEEPNANLVSNGSGAGPGVVHAPHAGAPRQLVPMPHTNSQHQAVPAPVRISFDCVPEDARPCWWTGATCFVTPANALSPTDYRISAALNAIGTGIVKWDPIKPAQTYTPLARQSQAPTKCTRTSSTTRISTESLTGTWGDWAISGWP